MQQYKQSFLIWLEILVLAWQLSNTMDEYYNNKMLKKAIMQIKR